MRSKVLIHAATLVAFAALCATLTYWTITIASRQAGVPSAASATAPLETSAAQQLFGGDTARASRKDVRVVGILALGPGRGSAAILALADGVPRALVSGQAVDGDTYLAEVRARSVILERHGVRSEVFLPDAEGANAYLR